MSQFFNKPTLLRTAPAISSAGQKNPSLLIRRYRKK